jgi:hypothetical protein
MFKRPRVSHLICQLRQLAVFRQKQPVIVLVVAYRNANGWGNTDIQPPALALNLNGFSAAILQEWDQKRLDRYFLGTELEAR